MALKDYIKDLTTYAVGVGCFDKIKIVANKDSILFEGSEKEKEVILKGKFEHPSAELSGEFGLANLSLLQTIISDPEFNSKESEISVKYKADKSPDELIYQNKSKSYVNYRFTDSRLLPQIPEYVEQKYNISISPSKHSIQQFMWVANGLASYEQYFMPRIVDGNLKFFIGAEDAATQKGGVLMASDRSEKLDSKYSWKIQQVINVLKVADTCDCEMHFTDKGAIVITLKTGVATYKYIFLGKIR